MWNKHSGIVLLSAGLIALAGCQKEEGIIPVAQGQYTLTLEATKGIDTKALSENNNVITASWQNTEKVAVFKNGTHLGDLSVDPQSDPKVAKLSGYVNSANGIESGDRLTLIYPARNDHKWTYTGQGGTLAGVSSNYDYAVADITVQSIDNTGTIVTDPLASFSNEQSIYRFKFNNGKLAVAYFIISAFKEKLVTNRTYNTSAKVWESEYGNVTVTNSNQKVSYVSLRNDNTGAEDTYYFTVVGSDNKVYFGNKTIGTAHLGNGKFVEPAVTVNQASVSKSSGAPETDSTHIW